MAESPQPNARNEVPLGLPDRALQYRQIVERVVTEVGEHPDYEMKRACSFQSISDKIEFVKDIQSIATSRIDSEKYLVIGADDKARAFHHVTNCADFDEATVKQILERYLAPAPAIEIFQLDSSKGSRFVLVVIPKQRQRRILAKSTVHSDETKPRLLLREGDLWTKGSSTGKRLAKPEDWDEIYENVIEAEAERRARARTAHMIELAVAREKVKSSRNSSLPVVFTDEEFKALMEELCAKKDQATLAILLERFRDETVEDWNRLSAFEVFYPATPTALSEAQSKVREHITNVVRPAMHWITLAGIYAVKNNGPVAFLDAVVHLLQEVFETTHKLHLPKAIVPRGLLSKTLDDHVSHTTPALESLIALHLIGAYLAKRGRFEYFKSILRPDVFNARWEEGAQGRKRPMAFWPLETLQYGEPEDLGKWGGRLRLCAGRATNDPALRRLFGTENATVDALSKYEFCLELNSFVSFPELSPETGKIVRQLHPDLAYEFRADFLAESLAPVHGLAATLLAETKRGRPQFLNVILFDEAVVTIVTNPASTVFADFLDNLAKEHSQVYLAQQRFTPMSSAWPKDMGDELKRVRGAKKQEARH